MSRTGMLSAIGLVGLSLVIVGCQPKAPETPPPPPPPPVTVPPPQEVAPPPPPVVDETPSPWDADIEEINKAMVSQGLVGDIHYDFDKFDLRADAREQLAKNAAFMREHPTFRFTVEGHCDERGTNEYNITLGQSRSSAAVEYLQSLGVTNVLTTLSYGEERPVCTDASEPCWWRNRRARFIVTGK